jgi:hypothetical protein
MRELCSAPIAPPLGELSAEWLTEGDFDFSAPGLFTDVIPESAQRLSGIHAHLIFRSLAPSESYLAPFAFMAPGLASQAGMRPICDNLRPEGRN